MAAVNYQIIIWDGTTQRRIDSQTAEIIFSKIASGVYTDLAQALTDEIGDREQGDIDTLAAANAYADSLIGGTFLVSGEVVDADLSPTANISDTKLATISTAGKVSNSATTATSSDTANAIVARDASGNFSAGTITATLSGNASTATSATSFTGSLSGDVTGTQSSTAISDTTVTGKLITGFSSGAGAVAATDTILQAINKLDGNVGTKEPAITTLAASKGGLATDASAFTGVVKASSGTFSASTITNSDISATAAIADTKLDTISTAGKVSNSATTATSSNTASTIVARDASGNFSAGTITANLTGNVSGSAASFTGSLSGDVTGTQSSTAISDSTVTGKLITGFSSGAGTVAGTDTILQAINKLDGNIGTKEPAITTLAASKGGLATNASAFTGVVKASSGVFSAATVVDADVSATAAIGRSKIASGTASHVIINNGSGVLSSEQYLDKTRGGTGITSTATFPSSGVIVTEAGTSTLTNKTVTSVVVSDYEDLTHISTPASPSAGALRFYAKSDNKLYVKDSGGTETQIGAGGGGSPTYTELLLSSSATQTVLDVSSLLVGEISGYFKIYDSVTPYTHYFYFQLQFSVQDYNPPLFPGTWYWSYQQMPQLNHVTYSSYEWYFTITSAGLLRITSPNYGGLDSRLYWKLNS